MTARNAIIIVGLGIFSLAGCLRRSSRKWTAWCATALFSRWMCRPRITLRRRRNRPPRPPVDPSNEKEKFLKRMEVPGTYTKSYTGTPYTQSSVPGSDAKGIVLPKNFKELPEKEKQAALDKFFKAQMEVGPDPRPVPGPDGHPLSLADLQKMAREHSPLLRQAASDIKAADGDRIQAGVYTNPTFSYDTTPGLLHQRQHRGPRHQPDDSHDGQEQAGGSGGQDGPGKRQTRLPPCRNRLDGQCAVQLLRGAGGRGRDEGQPRPDGTHR